MAAGASVGRSDHIDRAQRYPSPLVFDPLDGSSPQKTFILLHGRGSTAHQFGPPLLEHPIPSTSIITDDLPIVKSDVVTLPAETTTSSSSSSSSSILNLRSLFPSVRFVFPGASTRRAVTFKRSRVSQWFDMHPLPISPETDRDRSASEQQDWIALEGLRETTDFLHNLIRSEATIVGGASNIILGGLSQGCAAAMVALLLWDDQANHLGPIGAFIGMCSWLPFNSRLEDIVLGERTGWHQESSNVGELGIEDPFAVEPIEQDAADDVTLPNRAINLLRRELELPTDSQASVSHTARTPMFLGHGTEDAKVSAHLSIEAARCLTLLGFKVHREEYPKLGHWYSGEMLRDAITLLNLARQN